MGKLVVGNMTGAEYDRARGLRIHFQDQATELGESLGRVQEFFQEVDIETLAEFEDDLVAIIQPAITNAAIPLERLARLTERMYASTQLVAAEKHVARMRAEYEKRYGSPTSG